MLEACRCKRQQAGAVVGALEGDDAGLAGDDEGRPERDLDRVLARDAEQRVAAGSRQPLLEGSRDVGLGEIAERVHAAVGLRRDRLADLGVAVAESRDTEAAREVEVLAAVVVDDPAALRLRPPHAAFRPGRSRLSVSKAT
jgi:hypothetical protein